MLSKDFKDFVTLLNSNEVDYLVVGGYAMALHGRPRYTGDLDVWIGNRVGTAAKMMKVLHEFGFGNLGLTEADFIKPDHVVQLGYPPFRIDLLTNIDGVDFETAWKNRQKIVHDDQLLYFIGLSELKRNKQATGRPRDLDDLESLP